MTEPDFARPLFEHLLAVERERALIVPNHLLNRMAFALADDEILYSESGLEGSGSGRGLSGQVIAITARRFIAAAANDAPREYEEWPPAGDATTVRVTSWAASSLRGISITGPDPAWDGWERGDQLPRGNRIVLTFEDHDDLALPIIYHAAKAERREAVGRLLPALVAMLTDV